MRRRVEWALEAVTDTRRLVPIRQKSGKGTPPMTRHRTKAPKSRKNKPEQYLSFLCQLSKTKRLSPPCGEAAIHAAERAWRAEADIIGHDKQNIGCALGRLHARWP